MAGISRRINRKPKGFVKNTTAQGLVENLIVTMLFLTAVIFTIIQISLITINALIAGEAAFAAARASVVAPSATLLTTPSGISSACRARQPTLSACLRVSFSSPTLCSSLTICGTASWC